MTKTKEDEGKVFELLDGYASRQHQCFVTELFLNENQTEYVVCFRPKGTTRDSPNRFSCVYLRIEPEQLRTMARANALTPAIVKELNSKLPNLGGQPV